MKNFKKILVLLMAVLMILGCFTGCEEKSDWEAVQDNGKMVVGITLFAPMNYKDENGEYTGFETEFAQAVGEKLGVEIEFKVINWDYKEVDLNGKKIDCIWNGMTITDERKENMSISIPYMSNKQVLVTKAENVEKYSDVIGLNGANIVAETKSAGETVAKEDETFAGTEYKAVNAQSTVLMEVKTGTADAGLIDYVMSIGSIGEGTDFSDLKIVDTMNFSPEEYGIAFRKGSDLTEKVNDAIKELVKDGTLDKIAEKYKLQDLIIAEAE